MWILKYNYIWKFSRCLPLLQYEFKGIQVLSLSFFPPTNKLAQVKLIEITACWKKRSTLYYFYFFFLKGMLKKVYHATNLVIAR